MITAAPANLWLAGNLRGRRRGRGRTKKMAADHSGDDLDHGCESRFLRNRLRNPLEMLGLTGPEIPGHRSCFKAYRRAQVLPLTLQLHAIARLDA
jgi:hypothetical protein